MCRMDQRKSNEGKSSVRTSGFISEVMFEGLKENIGPENGDSEADQIKY